MHPNPQIFGRTLAESEFGLAWLPHSMPLHVGERLVVAAPFHAYQPQQGEVVILIEPGLAFGTGHHPTTRRCLEVLERLVTPGCHMVDVGTGSGILAIAAAKLGAGSVTALETGQDALRAGRAHVRANDASQVVRCYRGTLPHSKSPSGSADLVVANTYAKVLIEQAPALRDTLKLGGWLVASGILQHRQAQVEAAFAAAGLRIRETLPDEHWVTLLAQR